MDAPARYEFRIWGENLLEAERGLEELGTLAATRSNRETYLPVKGSLDVNPKIRDGTLDVKVLLHVVDGFEQWEPRLKSGFPVSGAMLKSGLFPLLGLAPPPLALTEYQSSDFVSRVVQPHPMLDVVEVTKTRRIYNLESSSGEVAAVTIAGIPLVTVAIESENLDALRDMRERLGLAGYQNQSYPRAIRTALGRSDD